VSKTPGPAAAFFDVDRTLIRGSALLAMIRPLYRHGYVQPGTLVTSVLRQAAFSRRGYSDAQLQAGADLAASLVQGLSATELERLGHELVPQIILPRIFPQAQAIMQRHRDRGDLIFIVSSAPREIVAPLAAALGADGFASTVADSVDGVYTGTVSLFMHGRAKAEAVKELAQLWHVDLANSAAYGDSEGDAHMLAAVGNPFCVNPDRGLLRIAVSRRWPCLAFSAARELSLPSRQELRGLVTRRTQRHLHVAPAHEPLGGLG
jgi:HAD superfamily hydrolase (TIGR01490 family)